MKETANKRKGERTKYSESPKFKIEIPLPFPKNFKITKPLIDLSEQGASFIVSEEEGTFLPGTPFKDIVISANGKKINKTEAKVIYSIRAYRGDAFDNKIGIQFIDGIGLGDIKRVDDKRIRPIRYNAPVLGKDIVSFACAGENEIVGEIANMSKFGVAFIIKAKEEVLMKSQILKNFKVIVNNEVIFSGKATVATLREMEDNIIVGVSLAGYTLDIQKGLSLWKSRDFEDSFAAALESEAMDAQISRDFKAVVADIRNFLEKLKTTLDEMELRLVQESEDCRVLTEKGILHNSQKYIKTKMDAMLKELNDVAKNISVDEEPRYRRYYQNNLHHDLLQSPFCKRVFEKPWGYPGDFEMVKMICRNTFEGKTLFQKALHKYDVGIAPAQGHRNRAEYIVNVLTAMLKDKERISIASIGCGPAMEINDLLDVLGKNTRKHASVYLVDFDARALERCQEELLDKKSNLKLKNVQFEFIEASIRQVLKKWEKNPPFPELDLIYMYGLFDYFSDSVCTKLLGIFYPHVRKGGRIMISNVSLANEFKSHMELGGEWYINYRDKDTLLSFGKTIPSSQVTIETDATQTNLFLNMVKS